MAGSCRVMNSKGFPCPLKMAALPEGKLGSRSFICSEFYFKIPVACQYDQSSPDPQKYTCLQKDEYNGIGGRDGVFEEHEDDVARVAYGVRQVHQEADIGPFFCNGYHAFE